MKKILGILGLLVFICVMTALMSDRFLTLYNIENLLRRSALFGILSIGAAFVIITAGIDLSIGSVVCLIGCLLPWMLVEQGISVPVALGVVVGISLLIGVTHGLLITKLKLQPFVVTLCGLLFYRGFTRGLVADQTQGFRGEYKMLRELSQGQIPLPGTEFGIPMPCLILVIVAALAIVFLNYTVYGRYMLALGRNETATRFSGINTDRITILAYVICGALSGLGGLLFVLDVGSAQPVDFGNFYELYAIAGAVLGGCSLRGGEGTIIGVVIGAAVMQVLKNTITLVDWIPTNIEYAVIGAVILGGVIADEAVKRYASRRRLAQQASNRNA
ncbi:Ribose transport system permease protein RbsC [Rubripirellula lacrimiformis]|uniref:Ribose transport system permease protein RbsC n=1 Tax=Rubripirellula lacrimiformis TaxID=1930273 RepID=A0A517N7K8_9BACT|nr:ABC transporter permease [Rubripirellula lacrimiformis]QDT03127.1 Ribose transport system permease protein RbsC [Rubripirellula lacrimiformis]